MNFLISNSIKIDHLIATWFTNKFFFNYLKKLLGRGIQYMQVVSGFELEIRVPTNLLYPILYFCNKHTYLQYRNLIDIVSYDTIGKKHRFFIVYNLLSIFFNGRIRLVSKIKELGSVLSVVSLYKSASWSEREVFDFFGIFFFENKDLRRILTDYGFRGFPLRKDFPVTGYVDVYYDDNQKRICYQNLELTQEYRTFNFKSNWNAS
jgi:NADH:ubiquinone oxidoreductase subunit C